MVCGSTTKNRLGPRMDRPRSTTHCAPFNRRGQSAIPPPTSNRTTWHSRKTNQTPPTSIRLSTTPIPRLPRRFRTAKREGTTSLQNVGPRHRPKTWRTSNPHQQNHPPLPNRTRRTLPIPQRAHCPRNHSAIKESLRRVLLLHQKEERQTPTRPRLSTSKHLDDQEPIPPSTHPLLNRPSARLHQVHRRRHQVGVQRGTDQTRRSMEGGVHH